jgi:hypothetical protein
MWHGFVVGQFLLLEEKLEYSHNSTINYCVPHFNQKLEAHVKAIALK